MQPKVVPGCQTPVKDGTVIVTGEYDKRDKTTPAARRTTRSTCPATGRRRPRPTRSKGCSSTTRSTARSATRPASASCRTTATSTAGPRRRMVDEKNTPPNKPEHLVDDHAVHRPLHHVHALRALHARDQRHGRAARSSAAAHHAEIDVFPGEPLENKLAGNVVDLCPVGALGSQGLPLQAARLVPEGRPTASARAARPGAAIHVDANKDIVYRLRPRENPQAQGYFMCDEGRYGYHYANAADRIKRPQVRRGGQARARPARGGHQAAAGRLRRPGPPSSPRASWACCRRS